MLPGNQGDVLAAIQVQTCLSPLLPENQIMSASVAITFVLIVLARISNMTLDTIRLAAVVQGRRIV